MSKATDDEERAWMLEREQEAREALQGLVSSFYDSKLAERVNDFETVTFGV